MTGQLSRREFTKVAAAGAMAPRLLADRMERGTREAAPTPTWEGYARATVIDCLASPGPFNVRNALASPLTHEMVRNARESGITAVNLTVASGDFESVFEAMGYWERELRVHPDVLTRVVSTADLKRAKETGRLGLIYGFQNAVMLGTDLGRLDLFYNFGVRIIQLTYNDRNALGDGCLEPANAGLSRYGRQVVERMNEMGILVDLGHCGAQTTADAIAVSTKPVAITHSGCRAVYDHPRSKRDQELKALADKGGVIGIYLMPFLSGGTGPSMAEDLIKHIEHAINVCGEDHVGIGSDCSVTPHVVDAAYIAEHKGFVEGRVRRGISAPREDQYYFIPDLNSPRRMEMIADKLLARRHSPARVEKIVGGNFSRLFAEVWAG
jgi:membrane dipeptidase